MLRNLPFKKIKQGSVLDIPYPDHSFDVVYACGLFPVIPDLLQAQEEIARVLKPNGHLVAYFYAKWSLNYDKGSTELAAEKFKLYQLNGDIIQMNAESMTFGSETFDHIYSCGVIFASPCPESIVKEMFRVLKKGGTATVMLYNRTSINYYFEIMFLRKIFRQFLRPKYSPMLINKLTGLDRYKLERHRELLKKKFTREELISVNTDGPDNPLSRVYNNHKAENLFTKQGLSVLR